MVFVGGSSPSSPTFGRVVQRLEHLLDTQGVVGSNPASSTMTYEQADEAIKKAVADMKAKGITSYSLIRMGLGWAVAIKFRYQCQWDD
jgi:hypothetical protein